MKCKGCGINQDRNPYGRIFLTEDGYCTVCNHKFRNRVRHGTKGLTEYVIPIITKKGKYDHLDHEGKKITNNGKLKLEAIQKCHGNKAHLFTQIYYNLKYKDIRRLDEWI